jgi:peptidoglycan/xylan/chitin deacetylase (PgdA/CDA1 family)
MIRAALASLSPAGKRARLSILIFHRVHAQRDPLSPGEVTQPEFDAICSWLCSWCAVMPLERAVESLGEGTLPARAVAITFDDGYRDNYEVALPILLRHGLPATFFVASAFLDGGRMWNDTIIESIRLSPESRLDLSHTPAAALGSLELETVDERRKAIGAVIGVAKYLPTLQRDELAAAVAQRAGAALPYDLMTTAAQVKQLHDAGMTIGAHTHTHPILRGMPAEAAADEIESNCRALSAITGVRPTLFAYPNGQPSADYDDDTVRVVREAGFRAAVSTAWGAARAGHDSMELPRYMPWERTRLRFGLRMAHTLATT